MGRKKSGRIYRSDEANQRMFQLTAKRCDFWFGNAESYKRAASILLEKIKEEEKITPIPNGKGDITILTKQLLPPVGGPYVHLLGPAIENELKAILIALDPEKFVTEEGLEPSFATHNLQKLAQLANELQPGIIPLDKAKIATFDRLWLAIEGGKYNIGKTPRDYDKTDRLGLGISGGKGGHSPKYERTPEGESYVIDESSGDIADFNELFGTLEHIYRSLFSPASE